MPSVPRQQFGGGAMWLAPPPLPFFVPVVAVVVVAAVVRVVRVGTDL